MRFTNSAIKAIPNPQNTTDYRDKTRPNLVLRITKNNCRTFYFVYQDKGKKRQGFKLGRYTGEGSLKPIFAHYSRVFTTYHLGEDPGVTRTADKQKATQVLLVSNAIENYLEYIRPKLAPNTVLNSKSALNKYVVPVIGSIPVANVCRADIVKVLDRAESSGISAGCNALLSRTKALFSWMVDRGILESSPAMGIKKPARSTKRRTALTDNETRELLQALPEARVVPDQSKRILRLLLLTGARRTEAVEMTWDEVDLEAGLWNLGKIRTLKTQGSVRTIPLTETLIALLGEQTGTGGSTRVFNLSPTTLGRHMRLFRDSELAHIDNLDLHTLRHTFITMTARLGIPNDVSMKLSGHVAKGVHADYQHHTFLDETREAMVKIDEHVRGLEDAE